jgi:ABC-2 type transport system ATP-binding protein
LTTTHLVDADAVIRAAMPPAIGVDAVTVRYGDRVALDAISLSVREGAVFGLLGPNGSGKTTLLSLVAGRRQPQSGDVRLHGDPLSYRARAAIGAVFQEPSLDPLMTVGETMALHARLFGVRREIERERTALLLERLGLTDRERMRTSTLSGGLKRRLELARALLPSPATLLLDEPTLALDLEAKQAFWHDLIEANRDGATILLATNDVGEAERYCSAVALLDAGRIVAHGIPSELKRNLRRDAVHIEWIDDPAPRVDALAAWDGVGAVRLSGRTTHVTVDDATPFLARVFREFGEGIHTVRIEQSTLEDVYFQLVGRSIAGDGS